MEAPLKGRGTTSGPGAAGSLTSPPVSLRGPWHKFSLRSFPEEKLKGSMMGAGAQKLISVLGQVAVRGSFIYG